MYNSIIAKCLPNLEQEVLKEIYESCDEKSFPAQSYVVKQGQYVRFLPIVLSGSIKVFSTEESNHFYCIILLPAKHVFLVSLIFLMKNLSNFQRLQK